MPTPEFNAALILLASLYVGTSQRRIRRVTKLSRELIQTVGTRLRKNRIWVGSKVYGVFDDPDETGVIELFISGATAMGWVQASGQRVPQKRDG